MKTATFPSSFFNKAYNQFSPFFEADEDIHYFKEGIFVQAILPPSPLLEEEELIFSEGDEMRKFVAHFSEATIIGWCRGDLKEESVASILKNFTQNLKSSRKYEEEKEVDCLCGVLFGEKE